MNITKRATLHGLTALAFAGVVVLTMLSAMSFDPRLLWDTEPDTVQPVTEGKSDRAE